MSPAGPTALTAHDAALDAPARLKALARRCPGALRRGLQAGAHVRAPGRLRRRAGPGPRRLHLRSNSWRRRARPWTTTIRWTRGSTVSRGSFEGPDARGRGHALGGQRPHPRRPLRAAAAAQGRRALAGARLPQGRRADGERLVYIAFAAGGIRSVGPRAAVCSSTTGPRPSRPSRPTSPARSTPPASPSTSTVPARSRRRRCCCSRRPSGTAPGPGRTCFKAWSTRSTWPGCGRSSRPNWTTPLSPSSCRRPWQRHHQRHLDLGQLRAGEHGRQVGEDRRRCSTSRSSPTCAANSRR